MFKFLILMLFSFLLASCDVEEPLKQTHMRPNKVPKTAFWQGSVDGGQWYQCNKESIDFQYYCTIYNDFTGDIEYQGSFEYYVINGVEEVSLKEYLKKTELSSDDVSGFDGSAIHLQTRLMLRPVIPRWD